MRVYDTRDAPPPPERVQQPLLHSMDFQNADASGPSGGPDITHQTQICEAPGHVKIDQSRLQKWLKIKSGTKKQKLTRSEISQAFSCCFCLIDSFRRNSDEPAAGRPMRVDMKAVRETFEKIHKKEWITRLVDESLQKLITTLLSPAVPEEALEILLILPECHVLHQEDNVLKMIFPLAGAISSLSGPSMNLLRSWWSDLKKPFLQMPIKMFTDAVAFILTSRPELTCWMGHVICVLRHLYQVNKMAASCVPAQMFHIAEIGSVDTIQNVYNWRTWQQNRFLLNVDGKIKVFKTAASIKMPPLFPRFKVYVRRSHLMEDTFKNLEGAKAEDVKKLLQVEFIGEKDLKAEKWHLFHLISKELTKSESGMFWHNDLKTMIWFTAKVDKIKYFQLGLLCGIAMHNDHIINLPFPLALYKKLLDLRPTLSDLKELDSTLVNSLQDILDYGGDVENDFGLNFVINWDGISVPLVEDGENQMVTNDNCQEFVDAYVDYVFNVSVKDHFEEFERGIYMVCDPDVIDIFEPKELMEFMAGNAAYEWDKLKKNAVYEGVYHAKHKVIIMFWNLFDKMSSSQRKRFLLFVTGSERVPSLGMESIKMKIVPVYMLTEDQLPEALNCHKMLNLPMYRTLGQLEERLLRAIGCADQRPGQEA
ncbi:probable E3 ubiquitin-protein ligase HERC6 isoform X2 [Erpetoichthys calabaricus]|uniref:probable E3 ubiquitin-protein ligase HERC6 isoform X2 n=1 Tax=Erpetoichthys calabaricus TaxID=27687 RepID=UPI0022345F35|nr:probable E3 ubiquitin-protein ligase HERC6 isoform X2 [Erpetoichthys calabaricus]